MDDQDQITGTPENIVPPNNEQVEGEGVPVPSRIRDAVNNVRQRVKEEAERGRDVVREYEDRYHGRRLESPPEEEIAGTPPRAYVPQKFKRMHDPASIDENERKWAALAHGSTLLTALVALASGGLGVLITMLVPLCIYFSFRKRSEYVAFHALQAFTIQLVGTVGWLALFIVGTIVGLALFFVSLILIVVLVGIILAPLVVLLYVLFVLVSLLLPVAMVIYSVIAAVETWNGQNYRYPYIARWVESQMHSNVLM